MSSYRDYTILTNEAGDDFDGYFAKRDSLYVDTEKTSQYQSPYDDGFESQRKESYKSPYDDVFESQPQRKESKKDMKKSASYKDVTKSSSNKDLKRSQSMKEVKRKESKDKMRDFSLAYVSEDDIPVKPIRFRVPRAAAGTSPGGWQSDFPLELSGVVDKTEYYRTVLKVNDVVRRVTSKWCYTDGFIGSMFVSGVFVLLPYIPAIVLTVKRENKIKRRIQEYLDQVNVSAKEKGVEWVVDSPMSISIVIDHKKITSQQQQLLLLHINSDKPVLAGSGSS